jgi:type IV pilus assembly protein PilM
MKSLSFESKLGYALTEPHYPELGIEFDSDALRLIVVRSEKGRPAVVHIDSEPLPQGAVEITAFKPNILSLEAVASALKNLWSRNPHKSNRACLLIQDRSALAFNVAMEHSARSATECLELLRFKLKKNVPFRIEDAQISYFTPQGANDYSGINLWVLVMNHAVLHQYEQLLETAIDAEIGLVDLSTLGLINLSHPTIKAQALQDKDILYVNLSHDYVSLAITQKSRLTSFRTRPLEGAVSRFEAAMDEIHPTIMYYQDKLVGAGFAGVYVHAPEHAEELYQAIQANAEVAPSPFLLDTYAASRFDPSKPAFLRPFAPLAGSLLSRMESFR